MASHMVIEVRDVYVEPMAGGPRLTKGSIGRRPLHVFASDSQLELLARVASALGVPITSLWHVPPGSRGTGARPLAGGAPELLALAESAGGRYVLHAALAAARRASRVPEPLSPGFARPAARLYYGATGTPPEGEPPLKPNFDASKPPSKWAAVRQSLVQEAAKRGRMLDLGTGVPPLSSGLRTWFAAVDAARMQRRLASAMAVVTASDRPPVTPGGALQVWGDTGDTHDTAAAIASRDVGRRASLTPLPLVHSRSFMAAAAMAAAATPAPLAVGHVTLQVAPPAPIEDDEPWDMFQSARFAWALFWVKCRGGLDKPPPNPPTLEVFYSSLGALIALILLASVHATSMSQIQAPYLIGAWGASAVLLMCVPKAPLAQPRNVLIGSFGSAIIGVVIQLLVADLGGQLIPAAGLAISLAIAFMQLTGTLHPPAGAMALIAVLTPSPRWAGFFFVLFPVCSGNLLLVSFTLAFNNVIPTRSYPLFW